LSYSKWVLTVALISSPIFVGAQILPREDQKSDAGLEEIYDNFEEKETEQVSRKKREEQRREEQDAKAAEKEISRVSDLATLAPFEDIAVIQRRFLPKTKRFEASGSGLISTNNQYFNNIGLGARLAFYFNEKYGIEGTYLFMTSSERPITEGLVDNQRIKTKSLVEPEGYYGVSFKWMPVYGKVAWFQEKIIPFDFYFTPGFGVTSTAAGSSDATFALGMGQLFALSKSMAVRWDFNWHSYQSEIEVDGEKESRNQNDLYLGVGVSFFFPEATYR
jgi:outer membrane beta-barrel protein